MIQFGGYSPDELEEYKKSVLAIFTSILKNRGDSNNELLDEDYKTLMNFIDNIPVVPGEKSILDVDIQLVGILENSSSTSLFFLVLYAIENEEVVKICLKKIKEKGANLSKRNWIEETAIFGEVSGLAKGYPRSVYLKTLIECGCDPNALSGIINNSTNKPMYITPLILILIMKTNQIFVDAALSILYESGVDIEKEGKFISNNNFPITPLSVVITMNTDPNHLMGLINQGVDTNKLIRTKEGNSLVDLPPIAVAIGNGKLPIAEILSNVEMTDNNIVFSLNDETYTPLMYVISILYNLSKSNQKNPSINYQLGRTDFLLFISRFIANPKTDVNFSPKIISPLMMAIRAGDKDIMKLLLESPKLDINRSYGTIELNGKSYEKNALIDAMVMSAGVNDTGFLKLFLTAKNINTETPAVLKKTIQNKAIWKLLSEYNPERPYLTEDKLAAAEEESNKREQELLQFLDEKPEIKTKPSKKNKSKKSHTMKSTMIDNPIATTIFTPIKEEVKIEPISKIPVVEEEEEIIPNPPESIFSIEPDLIEEKKEVSTTIARKMMEKKKKKEELREKEEQIADIIDFWYPLIQKTGLSKLDSLNELLSIKEKVLNELSNYELEPDICQELQRLIPFFSVFDPSPVYPYLSYKKEICICGWIMSFLTNLLDKTDTCILLLKGGKAIQVETEIRTNDFDFFLMPKNNDPSTVLKLKDYAYQISVFLLWIIRGNSTNFQLSSAFIEKTMEGTRTLIPLSTNGNKGRLVNSLIDNDSIIKISMVKRDGTGFLALLDIGYGYGSYEISSPYVLTIYQNGNYTRVENKSEIIYLGIEGLLLERIYYWIIYKESIILKKQNEFFLSKLSGSLFILLDKMARESGQEKHIILGKYIDMVYFTIKGVDINDIDKRVFIYDIFNVNNIKLSNKQLDEGVKSKRV